MADIPLKYLDIFFNGKLRNDVSSVYLSYEDFQTLKNYRYKNLGIKGMQGMTKINASPTSYTQIDGGFFFKKDQPSESHIIMQTTSGSNSRLVKASSSDSPTPLSVPSQCVFTAFKTLGSNAYVNYCKTPDGSMAMFNGLANYIYAGDEARCARFIVYDPAGTFSYDYSEAVVNTQNDANNRAIMKSPATGISSVYIGALRPISGVKFYIGTANASTAHCHAYYWSGSAWVAVSTQVDSTSVGGKTLAQTGWITFDSTDSVAKISVINDNIAYFYKFEFDGVANTTTVYHATLQYPLQENRDIWSGETIEPAAFYVLTASIPQAYKTNVIEDDFVTADPLSYASVGLGGVGTYGDYLYAGFDDRVIGIKFVMGGAYVNANASVMSLDYWNGTAWTNVTITDGTSTGGVTFAHDGTVWWNDPGKSNEFRTNVGSTEQYYYYRMSFSADLSSDVRVDVVQGIPAQKEIRPFRFGVFWQNRIWNCNDQTDAKNIAWPTAGNTVGVFNGKDSDPMYIGGSEELIGGTTLFSRYGGDLYDNMILVKKNSTYLVDGTKPDDWKAYTVSDSIGCVAPRTIVKCDLSYELGQGLTKHVVMWRSARGIETFDGQILVKVSDDIEDFFKPHSDNYINQSMVQYESAFFDEENCEYHWCFATGTSTTLNKEYAYDLLRKKWFEVCRTQTEPTAIGTKRLNCGFSVEDSSGMKYTYGGTTDGYCERLEYGKTYDGEAIKYVWRTGDAPLSKTLSNRNTLRRIKYTSVSKNVETAQGALKVYVDGCTSNLADHSFTDLSQTDSTHVFTTWKKGVSAKGVTHSIYYEITSDTETIGSEPIALSLLFKQEPEDV